MGRDIHREAEKIREREGSRLKRRLIEVEGRQRTAQTLMEAGRDGGHREADARLLWAGGWASAVGGLRDLGEDRTWAGMGWLGRILRKLGVGLFVVEACVSGGETVGRGLGRPEVSSLNASFVRASGWGVWPWVPRLPKDLAPG